MADWQKVIFDLSDVKIVLFLHEKKVARYYELMGQVVNSRSTLASSLRDLQSSGIIVRRIRDTHPLTTDYSLTEKGKKLAQKLFEVKQIMQP